MNCENFVVSWGSLFLLYQWAEDVRLLLFIVLRIGWSKKRLPNLWRDDDLLWSTKNL